MESRLCCNYDERIIWPIVNKHMAISYVQWISQGVVEIELQGRLLCNYVCGAFRLIVGQHVALLIVHHVAQYNRLNRWPVMM